jgi:hypothetical protein
MTAAVKETFGLFEGGSPFPLLVQRLIPEADSQIRRESQIPKRADPVDR